MTVAMKKTLALLLLLAGLTLDAQAETLTWNGSEGHMTWNTRDTNWLQGGVAVKYVDENTVVFGDTGSGTVALYIPAMTPASVLVDSGKDYTFRGNTNEEESPIGAPNGYFSGTVHLTKSGSGTLTINAFNTITDGEIVLNEGTLVAGCEQAFGQGIKLPVIKINGGTLNLNGTICDNKIVLQGSATIGNGSMSGYDGFLTVEENLSLTLLENTSFWGSIILEEGSTFDMGGNTFHFGGEGNSNQVVLIGSSSSIGNGTLTGSLAVADNHRLSLLENTSFTGNISLGDHSTLDLGQNTIDRKLFTLSGDAATIGNGTIVGDLEVAEGHRLTLLENTSITGHILLNNNSTLDLGQNTLSNYMELCGNGNATIVNGTLALGSYTLHGASTTLTLGGNATLDLNGGPGVLNLAVTGTGNTMRNGGYLGTLTLAENSTLTSDSAMCSWDGPKSLVMNNGSRLDMVGQDFWINNLSALQVNGSATINGAYLRVRSVLAPYRVYKLGNGVENLNGEGTYYVLTGDDCWDYFDLNGKSVNFGIIVWDAEKESDIVIRNGTIDKSVEIRGYWPERPYSKLKLQDVTLGSNATFTMGDGAVLDLGDAEARLAGFTFTGAAATVDNGTLFVGNGEAATLNLVPSGTYRLELRGGALNLGNNAITKEISVTGNATIANGSIAGGVTVAENMSAHFSGETSITGDGAVTVDGDTTTVKALAPATPGLLKELSVSKGLIAGTDRQSSLADGLDISRMGQELKLENLVLTANNSISVGNGNTITLKDVTIKISDDVCQLVNGIYTIDLKSLINCDLEMQNVLLDASDLSLPEGFDPATTSVVFDFGDDVSIKQATGLDMRLGNYWSPSLNLDQQGKVIFTKLVETPEPATGTLSLLALAALAARRRK